MKIKVNSYSENHAAHYCEDESGKGLVLDLMVNGDLPEGTLSSSLNGKWFWIDDKYPYLEIALGVKELEGHA